MPSLDLSDLFGGGKEAQADTGTPPADPAGSCSTCGKPMPRKDDSPVDDDKFKSFQKSFNKSL